MVQAFTPQVAVSPCRTVRRRRELPLAGEILVAVGDVVRPEQVVARAELAGDLQIVRVAELLGVGAREAVAALRVGGGAVVAAGACLAEMRSIWGLFRSEVRSPLAGRVEFITPATGHLGIRGEPRGLAVVAYLGGRVVEVEPQRALVIESQATIVQGIFGVGGERIGVVHRLPVAPDEEVSVAVVPDRAEGAILVGGCSPSHQALVKAAQSGAVGFVTASLDDATLSAYVGREIGVAVTGDEAVSMSVMITEGFGKLPLAARTWQVLAALDGKQAALNGATQVRAGAQRPELVAAATGPGDPLERSGATGLQPGVGVRIIRVPYFGALGEVEELPSAPQQIASGAHARVVRVRLRGSAHKQGELVTVPRANVELL